MSKLDQAELKALQASASTAAAYLDACDGGARFVRLDPAYYQACGRLLVSIFTLVDAHAAFSALLELSPAARDVAESIAIGRRLEISRLGLYPGPAVAPTRASV